MVNNFLEDKVKEISQKVGKNKGMENMSEKKYRKEKIHLGDPTKETENRKNERESLVKEDKNLPELKGLHFQILKAC